MNGLVRCWLVALAAGLGLGCSGESSGGAAMGGAGQATSGAGAGAGVGTGGSAAGAAGVSSSGSANGGGGASSGGSGTGGAAFAPLVPLVTGHESTFESAPIDPNGPLPDCVPLFAKVGESTTIAGKQGVLYQSPCSGDMPYLLVGGGDQIMAHRVMGDTLVGEYEYVHSPVTEGESWVSSGATYTWHAVNEPIETKAGTFDRDCWERSSDVSFGLTYCRGTGLVKFHDVEANYELTIVSKNF